MRESLLKELNLSEKEIKVSKEAKYLDVIPDF